MHTLTELYIYPLKSCKGIELPQAIVEEKGLKDDRRYMLVDLNGKFITGRTHPQITQINIEFSKKGLLVSAPKHTNFYIQTERFTQKTISVQVWSDKIEARHCHSDYDLWFSEYIGEPCQLVYFSDDSTRTVKNRTTQISFADGYPLLLVNQASVNHLNSLLHSPVSSLHFRPNIVIKGEAAFIEDNWVKIQIGEVQFEVSKPCSRCAFINVDPKTGKPDIEEPLKTLSKFRFYDGEVDFGQNLIPINEGIIRNGDPIKVLETKPAPNYTSITVEESNNQQALTINFQSSKLQVTGNNQQLLLDQAEQAGVSIPYSCRSGKCGRCKTKLLDGEVNMLNKQGLRDHEIEEGYVLACSSIPLSDISIEH